MQREWFPHLLWCAIRIPRISFSNRQSCRFRHFERASIRVRSQSVGLSPASRQSRDERGRASSVHHSKSGFHLVRGVRETSPFYQRGRSRRSPAALICHTFASPRRFNCNRGFAKLEEHTTNIRSQSRRLQRGRLNTPACRGSAAGRRPEALRHSSNGSTRMRIVKVTKRCRATRYQMQILIGLNLEQ